VQIATTRSDQHALRGAQKVKVDRPAVVPLTTQAGAEKVTCEAVRRRPG
jgi:hypothetical protein